MQIPTLELSLTLMRLITKRSSVRLVATLLADPIEYTKAAAMVEDSQAELSKEVPVFLKNELFRLLNH